MAYKCLDCGHIFEEGEWHIHTEHYDYGSRGFDKRMYVCPLCKGNFEETTPCVICGSEHLIEELNDGICEECTVNASFNIDDCFEVGAYDLQKIEINGFLAEMFKDKEELESILIEALKREEAIHGKVDCERYINKDEEWFFKTLREEVYG